MDTLSQLYRVYSDPCPDQLFFFPAHGSDEELLETILYFMLYHSGNILAAEPKIQHLWAKEC